MTLAVLDIAETLHWYGQAAFNETRIIPALGWTGSVLWPPQVKLGKKE
jgi:hypothetical protein